MGSCNLTGSSRSKTRIRMGQIEKCSLCNFQSVTSTEQYFLSLLFQELCIRNNSKKSLEKTIFLQFAPIPGLLGERVFDYYDTDRDGYINFDQFLSIIEKFSKSIDFDLSSDIFELVDLKSDGIIDKEEFKQAFHALLSDIKTQGKSPSQDKKILLSNSRLDCLTFSTSTMTSINDGLLKNKETPEDMVDTVFEKFSSSSSTLTKPDFNSFLVTQSWLFSKFKEWFRVESWTNGTQLKLKSPNKKASPPNLTSAKIFSRGKWVKIWLQVKDCFLIELDEKRIVQGVFFIEGCRFSSQGTRLCLTYNSHLEERISFEFENEEDCSAFNRALNGKIDVRKFKDFYKIEDKIGSGKFSNVFVCKELDSGGKWAVKVVKKQKMDRTEREMIRNEVKIIQNCAGEGVVKVQDVFESHKSLKIVMELVPGGDLLYKITNEQVEEKKVKQIIKKILNNVKSLHDLGVIHRDIKPENIMVLEQRNEVQVKFIDFGLSTFCLPFETKKYKCGTLGYMAPEVVSGSYSKKVDIWSVGIITFAYITGKLPFYSLSKEEIVHLTQTCEPDFSIEKWSKFSKEAKDFTQLLLSKDPVDRPDVDEALDHCWFKI